MPLYLAEMAGSLRNVLAISNESFCIFRQMKFACNGRSSTLLLLSQSVYIAFFISPSSAKRLLRHLKEFKPRHEAPYNPSRDGLWDV